MEIEEKINYWKDLAQYDLDTAKAMLSGKRYLYVGSMCHQTIEKILKAYYTKAKEETPPFTQNLRYLAERSMVYDMFSEEQKDLLDELLQLNIEARYPTHKKRLLQTLSFSTCRVLIQETEGLCKWIEKRL